ncbi:MULTISPECIES: LCP family protein [unclassified Rhodococcus (in: high G+C Gram-positive bacteria)]|uniref:LCP family protein n=1 Tax=unclassified Rhodococcus (in: high G+C Gram-positive bacteria) TaxID=192944 RepID=UPI00359C2AB0
MSDDQTPGQVPEGRAPWERPLSHVSRPQYRPESQQPPGPPGPPDQQRTDSGRIGRRHAEPGEHTERISVSDLVNRDSPPPADSGRMKTPAVSPLPPARPRQDPVPDPPPAPTTGWLRRAEPEHVGPAAGDPVRVGAPGETRLAASKSRKQRRWRVLGRSAVAVAAAASVGITGVAWGYLRNTDNGFSQVAALDLDSTDVVDPGGQTGDETYLIVGTDTRAGANGGVGAGSVEDAEGARADTVILVNIPADRSRVVAVSFPRDLDIARPSCADWNSDTGQYSTEMNPAADNDKLNSAYAFGGPKCLVKVIQKMSGLKIGHFVAMDFSGFESMVNQVGGVEVCTTTPLVDGELGTVLPNAGKQTIDGATALNYVRARKVEAEGNGDYGRIKRQQMFLSSLLRGALSNKVLFDPGKLNGFINAFTRDTFVQNIDTKSLVMLGRSLQNVDAGAVTFLTVPTAGTNELGNEIPRQDDIDAIFQAIIDDEPLPGEERKDPAPSSAHAAPKPAAPAPPALEAVSPMDVSLQVSNGSGVTGLAATASDDLGAYGFQIYSVGNYSGTSTNTLVRYSPGLEAEAATVASSLPGAVLQESSDLGGIVEVVLGSSFSGKVAPPKSVGAALTPTMAPKNSSASGAAADALPADLAFTNAADDSCA